MMVYPPSTISEASAMLYFETADDFFRYHPTGQIYWNHRTVEMYVKHYLAENGIPNLSKWNAVHSGTPALATKAANGKKFGIFFGRKIRADQLVWLLHAREWRDGPIFHINGDNGDDRIFNLSRKKPNPHTRARAEAMMNPTDQIGRHNNEMWTFRDGEPHKKISRTYSLGQARDAVRTFDFASVME